MGGETFEVYMRGTDVQEVFREARAQALYEYGHRGYSGTIAEKDEVEVISRRPVPLEDAELKARELIRKRDPRVDDKWGPAGALAVGEDGLEGWLLFGWASS